MLLQALLLVIGLAALVFGADWLVDGASALARRLGVSSLVIGLTIVSFGTSLPELVVSVLAALQDNAQVSLGNVVGSNISNILLVLGVSALVAKRIQVKTSTVRKEIPFAALAALVLLVLAQNQTLGWVEGAILLLFFSIFLYYVYELMLATRQFSADDLPQRPLWQAWGLVVVGAAGLWVGGHISVDAAVALARGFGLSEYLISATIVAVGTSLPELVASVAAAFKGEVDLAVGNVVGSNIFNTFWILGLTALVAPMPVPSFLTFDLLVSLGAAAVLLGVVLFLGSRNRIVRAEGAVFVLLYVAYVAALVWRG